MLPATSDSAPPPVQLTVESFGQAPAAVGGSLSVHDAQLQHNLKHSSSSDQAIASCFPGIHQQQEAQAKAQAQQRRIHESPVLPLYGSVVSSPFTSASNHERVESQAQTPTFAGSGIDEPAVCQPANIAGSMDLSPGWSSRTPTKSVQTVESDSEKAATGISGVRSAVTAAPQRSMDTMRTSANQSLAVHAENYSGRPSSLNRGPQRANSRQANDKQVSESKSENTSFRGAYRRSEDSDALSIEAGSSMPAASGSASTSANIEKDGQARKQNSACDACRNRKVRCIRQAGEEKCAHCKSKGIDCTTIYVQLATSGAKRPTKRPRVDGQDLGSDPLIQGNEESFHIVKYLLLRDCEYGNHIQGNSFPEQSRRRAPTTAAESRLNNATARQEFVSSLLETYFSTVHIRYPILDPHEFLQRFHYQSPELGGPPSDPLVAVLLAWGAKFSSHPIILADRREAAHEELSPTQRQKRHAAHGASALENVARPLSRASSEGSSDFVRSIGRSRVAEELIVKAQEVLDRNKVHRIATMDNAKAALIIQALFWQQAGETEIDDATLPAQLRPLKRRGVYICNGIWVECALSHMFEMKVHLQETVTRIEDESQRSQISMSWWLACMMDAHMSAFYRRKPTLSQEDYTTEPPSPPASANSGQAGPQPTAAESGFNIWLNSALDQVEMMRSVYFTLFTPRASREGISARKLELLASMAYRWRSDHLKNVGAPDPDWPVHWKFVDAVTACSSDINYQIIWILMWQAIDEHGIAELNAPNLSSYNLIKQQNDPRAASATVADMEMDQSKIRGLRTSIYDEALKASLRCAHLAGMLCDFDYLQHEAGIMKFSLCEAGYCLTRFQRAEVQSIIKGLRQYGQAFEECYEQANELESIAIGYLGDNASNAGFFDGQGPTVPVTLQVRRDGPANASVGSGMTHHTMGKSVNANGNPLNWEPLPLSSGDGRQMQSGSAPASMRRGPLAVSDVNSSSQDFGAGRSVNPPPSHMPAAHYNVGYFGGQGNAAPQGGTVRATASGPSNVPQSQMGYIPIHVQQQQQQQYMPPSHQMYSSNVAGMPDSNAIGYMTPVGGAGPQGYRGQGLAAPGGDGGAQGGAHNPGFY